MTDPEKIKVLLVEDDEEDYLLLRDFLSDSIRTQFTLDWVRSFTDGLKALQHGSHDVYLVDYYLGAENGLELIKKS